MNKQMGIRLALVKPQPVKHTGGDVHHNPMALTATHRQTSITHRHLKVTYRPVQTHIQTAHHKLPHMMHWWCAMVITAPQDVQM